MQSQNAVTAHFLSEQLLLFGFVEQYINMLYHMPGSLLSCCGREVLHYYAVQCQNAVTASLKSKQLLPSGLARQCPREHKAFV